MEHPEQFKADWPSPSVRHLPSPDKKRQRKSTAAARDHRAAISLLRDEQDLNESFSLHARGLFHNAVEQ